MAIRSKLTKDNISLLALALYQFIVVQIADHGLHVIGIVIFDLLGFVWVSAQTRYDCIPSWKRRSYAVQGLTADVSSGARPVRLVSARSDSGPNPHLQEYPDHGSRLFPDLLENLVCVDSIQ